mmetsp:Transcript_55246/g.59846  ORF Transcript_55246/g.59846 Transcript_55246/m.59846 type:complete len:112 (-) Transcript_55246:260-595(-)
MPYATARPMAVEVPTTSLGRGDCYLDDIIKVYLGLKHVIRKHAASAPLALHVSMRPLADEEPVPRKQTNLPGVLNLISDWLSFDGTSRIENEKAKANPLFVFVSCRLRVLT